MLNPLACNWETNGLLSYFMNVPDVVVLYAHVAPFILAVLLFTVIFIFERKSLISKVLLVITFFTGLWILLDLLLWLVPQSEYSMFFWALLAGMEITLYMSGFYFMYVFIFERDLAFWMKATLLAVYMIPALLLATPYVIQYFDMTNCSRLVAEGPLMMFLYIPYLVTTGIILCMSLYGIYRFPGRRQAIGTMALGVLFFLGAFFWSLIANTVTDDQLLSQAGLLALPVFMGYLAYGVSKDAFENTRLFAIQFFVASIILLIGGQFFFIEETLGRVLVVFTLTLIILFSYILTRAIQNELRQKEELRQASESLRLANSQLKELDNAKTEFLSIASHQLRTPLTAIKGYISLILEGSYGEVSKSVQDVLNKLYLVNSRMVNLAEDLLNVSRIDAGRVQYNYHAAHLEKILQEAVEVFRLNAQEKGLILNLYLPSAPLPEMMMDGRKIQEVCSNLVDNSIKYTQEGSVSVRLVAATDRAIITVTDTGIGIPAETKDKLFAKFVRSKETNILDVSGTGLGLYVGKNFVEAHGGRIYADSPGKGKGSTFTIELPYINPKVNDSSPNWMLTN
jgi:signal transduction histidine kinase